MTFIPDPAALAVYKLCQVLKIGSRQQIAARSRSSPVDVADVPHRATFIWSGAAGGEGK